MFVARDIMRTKVITVTPETLVEEVIEILGRHRISGLPVVDHQNRPQGVITEHDVLPAIRANQLDQPVADHMSASLVVIDESTSLEDVTELFITKQIRRVPVTRDDQIVGMISRRDLIQMGNIRHQILDHLPVMTEERV